MLPMTTNFSPFAVSVRLCADAQARQSLIVVLGASFEALPEQQVRVAPEQVPIHDVDVHFGAPDKSSVRYDADLADHKRAVDFVVNGHAYAPGGSTAGRVDVGVVVDGLLHKLLSVSGDRFWRRGPLGRTASSPKAFRTMPIVYERAFGGSSAGGHHSSNPVGLGLAGAASADPLVQSEVPNIEHAENAGTNAPPAGFGFVSRGWAPRLAYAGSYDEAWLERQFPLVPHDFDIRFHQAAPVDQQLPSIGAGETVRVLNMTPEGRWVFRLPQLDVPVRLRYADRVDDIPVRADTVLLEPDLHRIVIRARVSVPIRRLAAPLEEVVVGRATPAWWLARVSRKHYRAGPGHDGRAIGAAYWHG